MPLEAVLVVVLLLPHTAAYRQILGSYRFVRKRSYTSRTLIRIESEFQNYSCDMFTFIFRIINQMALGHLKPPALQKGIPGAIVYDVPFRCWPIDMDMFMHLNNASYARVAELARWRIFPQTGAMEMTRKRGILFLVVNQQISYLKQLPGLQPYIIRTKVTVSDNKWIHYTHTFMKPPVAGKDPYIYGIVELKAVMKEKSGKTVRISELSQENDFYEQLNTTEADYDTSSSSKSS